MWNVSQCHYSPNFKIYTILTRKLHMNPPLIPKRSIKHDLQPGQARPHSYHPFPVVRSVHPYPLAHQKGGGGGCQAAVTPPQTDI